MGTNLGGVMPASGTISLEADINNGTTGNGSGQISLLTFRNTLYYNSSGVGHNTGTGQMDMQFFYGLSTTNPGSGGGGGGK